MKRKTKGLSSKKMSLLYKKARQIGYSKERAFKTVGMAKEMSKYTKKGPQKKLKKQHPWLDFDGDGKINKYDCQPLNRRKQDNVGVVGSRRSNEKQRELVEQIIRREAGKGNCLVSGHCYEGPDKWAEEEADKQMMKKIIHKPTGNRPEDFHARNSLIARDSHRLFGFVTDKPNPQRYAGTEQTIREAKERGIPTHIIFPDGTVTSYNKGKLIHERKKLGP